MALNIQPLNADTTFFLTFSPSISPPPNPPIKRFPGDFTILIDPWLNGHSSIFHPSFQISHHTSRPAIASLTSIAKDVDLILISQDKADHCHRETLCSLPKDSPIDILATPAAARKIRSWGYFNPSKIHVLKPYSAANPSSVLRIPLPAYSSSSAMGEVTIANIPTKHDITGVHNAIGITYQPPSTHFSLNTQFSRYENGITVQLSERGMSRPPTAPQRPKTPTTNPTLHKSVSYPYLPLNNDDYEAATPHSRPDSGIASYHRPPSRSNGENVLSVIYSPHGVSPRTLEPYIRSHLKPENALPVTALFHSMNTEENPWFMGGRVATGTPGGVELARLTGARSWIGAHDEVKDNRGMATVWIKGRQYDIEEVQRLLRDAGVAGTRVLRVGVGETLRVERQQKQRRDVVKDAAATFVSAVSGSSSRQHSPNETPPP